MERLADYTVRLQQLERAEEYGKFIQVMLRHRDNPFGRELMIKDLERAGAHGPARILKATVNALESDNTDLAPASISGGFLSVLSTRTLFGKIPFRRADFNTRTPAEIAAGSAAWVAEGEPIPASSLQTDAAVLEVSRIAGIIFLTDELIKVDTRGNASDISLAMLNTIGRYHDQALLDPAITAVAQKNPASLTANGTQVSVTGSTLSAITTDVRNVLTTLSNSGADLSTVMIAMHPQSAVYISSLMVAGGLAPTLGARGGELLGVPVLTTVGAVATGSPSERIIAAIVPAGVVVAEGNLEVKPGKLASFQASNTPGSGSQSVVSAWQTATTPLRFTRFINWQSISGACAYLRVAY
jgi:hypothetical protein